MDKGFRLAVLYGGTGDEREVSIVSGEAVLDALGTRYEVSPYLLDHASLPDGLTAKDTVVLPVVHGTFGEDGQLQALLDEQGIEYAGSDSASSRLCIDKTAAKEEAMRLGIPTPKSISFDGTDAPLADAVIEQLGTSLVVKPSDQGSSVGLHFTEHRSALGVALSQIHSGNWLIEQRVRGREFTVGLLQGKAMGIVEIVSASGVYDYEAKYTSGTTEYHYPADLGYELATQIAQSAERIFEACGCRDFARIDFLLEGDVPYFLEVNTLPGLTATSLLPKSASCIGLDFPGLVDELIAPAIKRFTERELGP